MSQGHNAASHLALRRLQGDGAAGHLLLGADLIVQLAADLVYALPHSGRLVLKNPVQIRQRPQIHQRELHTFPEISQGVQIIALRGHQNEGIRRKFLIIQLRRPVQIRPDGKIVFFLLQSLRNVLGHEIENFRRAGGVFLPHSLRYVEGGEGDGVQGHSHPYPLCLRALQLPELGVHGASQAADLLGVFHIDVSGLGQLRAVDGAHKKGHSQFIFQV